MFFRFLLFAGLSILIFSFSLKEKSKTVENTTYLLQDSLIEKGEELFMQNCARCHHWNMRSILAAPALKGTEKRWKGDEENLYRFIQKSQKLIKLGHPYAKKLYKAWGSSLMPANSHLEKQDIKAILAYIKSES